MALYEGGDAVARSELVNHASGVVGTFIRTAAMHGRSDGTRLLPSYAQRIIDSGPSIEETEREFRIRAHERAALVLPAPRPKQDKFGILDAPRLYSDDFLRGIGLLGVSVIYFDLDDFKAVNSRFSEPVVDRTLLPALMRLVASLAEGHGWAYAEGGDEFIMLLPNTNIRLAEAFAAVLLERIRATVIDVDGEQVQVSATAGISWSDNAVDGQACREAASKAKHAAKTTQPKGGWVVAQAALPSQLRL